MKAAGPTGAVKLVAYYGACCFGSLKGDIDGAPFNGDIDRAPLKGI